MCRVKQWCAGGLFVLLASGQAFAACTLSTTGLNFGTYDVFVTSAQSSTLTVTVNCTPQSPIAVLRLGPSAQSGGYAPRQMKHSSLPDRLSYNVYTDAAGTRVWGNGSSGTDVVVLRRIRVTPVTVLGYGKIVALQDVSAGIYTDVLTVTVLP